MTEDILREALPGDAPGILRCVCDAYAMYVERIGKKPMPMLQDYAEVIARDEVYVAESAQGDILGVLVLEQTPEGFFLDNIAVSPNAQGRGLGRKLLELAESAALRRGEETLYLYTNEQMWENQTLYERFGYARYDQRVVSGYARFFYRKRLTPG